MSATLALAGDTMLGRGVAEALSEDPDRPLVSAELAAHLASASLTVVNLECCISDRGSPFADPEKPFFFRAPPVAAERLADLGVDAVTLANNHALDYGADALLDTIELLRAAGIPSVGAGADQSSARAARVLEHHGFRLRLAGVSDHPGYFAAEADRPGIAYADLWREPVPDWVLDAAR